MLNDYQYFGLILMILAGTPTATENSGISEITTALAPITAWLPTLTLPKILAPAPISTYEPIDGASYCFSVLRIPIVTPCLIIQ